MKRRVSLEQVKDHLPDILTSVAKGDDVAVTDGGKVVGVLVAPARYEAMEHGRERFFALIDEIHEANRDVDPEELEREIEEAVREVRASGRGS